ncbi:MAG: hypothetical protein U1F76_11165 [Candidatus Competibacteraceae bacterium]
MKALNKAVLIGLSIGFSNLVFAENFKDYSVEPTPSLSEQATVHPENYLVSQTHFNEQNSLDYGVSSKGPIQCNVSRLAAAPATGFNDAGNGPC